MKRLFSLEFLQRRRIRNSVRPTAGHHAPRLASPTGMSLPFQSFTESGLVWIQLRIVIAQAQFTGYNYSTLTFKTTMKGLTARQQQILDLIREQISRFGRPPTRAEIARELGFKSANAAEDHLQALAKKNVIALDASTSRGIRLLGEYAEGLEEAAKDAAQSFIEQFNQLPLVGRVAAGSPILAQEHIEKHIPVDPSLFPEKPDYLLKVRGMSMKDIGIMDGDLLAVRKIDTARAGQVIVARVNDEVTVKRYFQKGSKVELHAENEEFQPILVDLQRDQFAIEGLAVGLIRQGHLH